MSDNIYPCSFLVEYIIVHLLIVPTNASTFSSSNKIFLFCHSMCELIYIFSIVNIFFLQEVEIDQYYSYFFPALSRQNYDGIFNPKSPVWIKAKNDGKLVDGCAIFFNKMK